jgi:hypothetical protein
MVDKNLFVISILMMVLAATVVLSDTVQNQHGSKRKTELPDTKDGLQLSIEVKGDSFHINDIPKFKVTLKNISRAPITIYKNLGWGRSSSLTLSILDNRNRMMRKTTLADASHVPPFPREDFITIQPDESIQKEFILGLRDEGIKAPGVYKVVVWYHSPIPRKFAPKDVQIWAMENGVLQSKPAIFKVTQ